MFHILEEGGRTGTAGLTPVLQLPAKVAMDGIKLDHKLLACLTIEPYRHHSERTASLES